MGPAAASLSPWVGLAAAGALGLLLWVVLRLSKKQEALGDSAARMEKSVRDAALDVRVRLDEVRTEIQAVAAKASDAESHSRAVAQRVAEAIGPLEVEAQARESARAAHRALAERVEALEESLKAVEAASRGALADLRQAADERLAQETERVASLTARLADLERLCGRLVAAIPHPMAAPAPARAPDVRSAAPGPTAPAPSAAAGGRPEARGAPGRRGGGPKTFLLMAVIVAIAIWLVGMIA
jgi:hypothetical protein